MMAAFTPAKLSSSVHVHLSCHCRTFNTTLTVPSTSLPLKSSICHCSLCRHSVGHIFGTSAVIPLPDKPDCTSLTAFDSSEKITRWFCSTCGCSIWNDDRGCDEWEVTTGAISGITYGNNGIGNEEDVGRGPGSPEGLSKDMRLIDGLLNRVNLWIGSTGDGGGAIWLNGGKLQGTQRKVADRNSETVDDDTLVTMVQTARSQLSTTNSNKNTLAAICACGRINLHITRASPATKFQAGIDACWSCRKTSGFEITSWATIPSGSISWAGNGRPVTLDEDVFGRYSTSAGVMRYFCRGCGVSVFWVREGRETWDLGAGLLNSGDGSRDEGGNGVRSEDWLVWNKYGDSLVAYVEDAIDEEFVAGLVEGVRRDQGRT